MDAKPEPNHDIYIAALRRLTPEQRLRKCFEMSAFVRQLFEQGLRKRFSGLGEAEFRKLLRQRLDLCHNRNY